MEKTNMERKFEQMLNDEREQLLSEVREAILRKKAMRIEREQEYLQQR